MLMFVEPLGPICVAACLERDGHECKVIDFRIDGEENGLAICKAFGPDVVGLQCNFTTERNRTIRLALRVKKEMPGVFVVVGGHDASRDPGWFHHTAKFPDAGGLDLAGHLFIVHAVLPTRLPLDHFYDEYTGLWRHVLEVRYKHRGKLKTYVQLGAALATRRVSLRAVKKGMNMAKVFSKPATFLRAQQAPAETAA